MATANIPEPVALLLVMNGFGAIEVIQDLLLRPSHLRMPRPSPGSSGNLFRWAASGSPSERIVIFQEAHIEFRGSVFGLTLPTHVTRL